MPAMRKIERTDRDVFIEMGKEFYASEAVLADIDVSYHEAAFDELMRSDEYLECYIFEDGKTACGYALLNKTYSREAGGRVIWIEELYVRREYRNKGIGSDFFEWLFENCPAARYRLETEPENVRACKLYSRLGFEPLPYIQWVLDKSFEN